MENKPFVENIAPGVRLCAVQTDRFKTGRITFSMALPLTGDIAANAILPFILHRSCRKYPDFSLLNGRLAELYGAQLSAGVSKLGEAQLLAISLNALDDRFSLTDESISQSCTELLLDLLFEPDIKNGSFDDKDVQREKRLLVEKMESELNDKRVYAMRRCEEIMCSQEKYGLGKYGTREDIESLTGERIITAWQNMLKTAVIQIDIVASGNSEGISKALKAEFSKIERKPVVISTQFIPAAKEPQKYDEQLAVKQGKLVLGFRAGMENAQDNVAAVRVMTDIFGGGTYSKLFANVREKMGLCYYCSARLINQKGILFVQSGIESENAAKAIAEIQNQLNLLKAGQVENDEFSASIMSICDQRRGIQDLPEELASWYTIQIFQDEIKTPDQDADEISKVTLEQVIAAANKVTLDTIYMLSGTGEGTADEN